MARIRAFVFLIGLLIPLNLCFNLPPILLNNGESHELIPIPLPWANEQTAREIDLSILLRTNAKNGGIFTLQSHEPDQFECHLALKNSQLSLEVRVNKKSIAASIDDSILLDVPTNISLIINFDKMEVILNGHKMHYYEVVLARREDSMIISLGSTNIVNTCVFVQKVSISGEHVKLEAANPAYAVCDPFQTLIISEVNDQKVLPPLGGSDDRGEVEHNQQPNEQNGEAVANGDENKPEGDNADGNEEQISGGENVLQRQKELDEDENEGKETEKVVPVIPQMAGADFNDIAESDQNLIIPKSDNKEESPDDQKLETENVEGGEEKIEEANIGTSNQENAPKQEDAKTPEQTLTILAKNPEIGEGTNPIEGNVENKPDDVSDQRPIPRPDANSPPDTCLPQQRDLCGTNSKGCEGIKNTTDFNCTCRDGYAGKRCQFSLLPRSCYEAFALNTGKINEPGAYELDVDGSGPLRSSWAYCNKDGHTIVEHNMPNETLIRQSIDTTDKYYPISYKLFENAQLKKLIEQSEKCNQNIKFECNRSPLSFSTNTTWFETATKPGGMVKQIGDKPDQCECPEGGCKEGRHCNCDSLMETSDEGILTKDNAGITVIYALKNPFNEADAKMKATLSPLKCSGNAGNAEGNSVTLKAVSSALGFQALDELTHFEVQFRTLQADIPSLISLDGSYEIIVSLRGGHNIDIKKKENEQEIVVANIMSQSRLSDLRWHRILFEIVYDEIRVSVDSYTTFSLFDKKSFPRTITLGQNAGNEGFVGCIRNLILNSEAIEVSALTRNLQENFADGCPNLCRGHNCEQGSKCIENFDTGTRTCQCANRFIHRGERCEKNVNTDTEVSFHDRKQGFLEFRNDELPKNPLESSIIAFSTRTDQKEAVLVYTHDQSDNFLQVHLADEFRIILTLSNYTSSNVAEIKSCTVFSRSHDEFSDMRWLQIIVERFNNRTTLSVDDEQCEILGPLKLAPLDTKIEDYQNKPDYAILPPKAQGSSTVIEAYQILFIGGVPRPHSYDNLRKKRARMVFYDTPIPPLLGCMRGFIIEDEIIDMRNNGKRYSKTGIQSGCHTECDSIVCENGGHCSFKWENRDPGTRDLTTCDCSKTSYFGNSCLKDIGVTFEGKTSLLYNIEKAHQFDLTRSEEQTFRFAFAPLANERSVQRIATIYLNNDQEIQIVLHANQSINVHYTGMPDRIYSFAGNYSDGYRHFFQAIFAKGSPVLFVIDSDKQYAADGLKLHLADATSFRFGGKLVSTDADKLNFAVIDAYKGCLSNVHIDFHQNVRTQFVPLTDYLNTNFDNRGGLILIDEPDSKIKLQESKCAAFLIPGVLPSLQRNVNFPIWEAVFSPVTFHSNFTPELSHEVGPEDGFPWWIIVLLILLFIIILLIICCCLFCRKPKNKRSRPPSIGKGVEPEKIPLQHEQSPVTELPLTPLSVKDNFELPPANKSLFKPDDSQLPDRPPIYHPDSPAPSNKASISTSIYYTAQEYPLDGDSIDTYADDNTADDLDKVLSQGFGEQRPNVLDKNTKNMLDKTNVNRVSSFDNADARSHPPRPTKVLTPAQVPQISMDQLKRDF
uniref:Uncharacterized protein n=1 Tax=Panagrolaimus sp. PS1159 TaxID=55785 RepID=A0AC35GGL4_9BILA